MPTSPDPCRGLNESKVRELRRQAMAEPVLLNYLVGEGAVEGVANSSRVGVVVDAPCALSIKPCAAAEAVAQIRRRAAHGVKRILFCVEVEIQGETIAAGRIARALRLAIPWRVRVAAAMVGIVLKPLAIRISVADIRTFAHVST